MEQDTKTARSSGGKDLRQQKAEKVPVIHTSFKKIYNFFSLARNPHDLPPSSLQYSTRKPAAKQEGYGYCAAAKLNRNNPGGMGYMGEYESQGNVHKLRFVFLSRKRLRMNPKV